MAGKIVEDFSNLQMFAAYDFFKMDDLVHDLTTALEESARSKTKGRNKEASNQGNKAKRRIKKRKNHLNPMMAWELGNMSEASESSIDEAINHYMENIAQHSDSDDLLTGAHLTSLAALTANHNSIVSLAESDSVNENFSPMRPHRRRRRYKRMAVDPQNPRQVQELLDCCGFMDEHRVELTAGHTDAQIEAMLALGKRKRSLRDRGGGSLDVDSLPEQNTTHNPEEKLSESGVSSGSSNESDGFHTSDEARDGDDEQSDFFHEAGPAYGIPGAGPAYGMPGISAIPGISSIPGVQAWPQDPLQWPRDRQQWPRDPQQSSRTRLEEDSLENLLSTSLRQLSTDARRKYAAGGMITSPARQIRAGRRRLKDAHSIYSLGCFLHDRQQWADHLKKLAATRASASTAKTYDPKRRKKMVPHVSGDEVDANGVHGNHGNKPDMLTDSTGCRVSQHVIWNPGMDTGVTSPSPSCKRPWRQGPGSHSSSTPNS